MSMPFYVAPEQMMKDKADYARTRIARGRPVAACTYSDGVLLVAENPSTNLFKISEIYDRIAFAGVGRYNEFDQMRQAGVRYADTTGYQFSRDDVDGRALANQYAQQLGLIFTHEMKPYEVEILVAEVGITTTDDQLFHVLYDGMVTSYTHYHAMGGESEGLLEAIKEAFVDGWELTTALKALVKILAGADREIPVEDLEVAILDRNAPRRTFRRLPDAEVTSLLA
jgi:proteasome alpha subunit